MFKLITYLALILSSFWPTIFQQLLVVQAFAIDDNTRELANSIKTQSSSAAQQVSLPDVRQITDTRRPIWNLAHMVNSIKELDYRLGKGANAVEVDVTFGKDGDPLYTYHGPPCDCWRHCHQQEDFHEYLRYVREIAIDERDGVGKNLTLLFLDLKLVYLDTRGKARAGIELAKSIVSNLFLDSPASSYAMAEDFLSSNLNNNNSSTLRARTPMPKRSLKLIISVNHVSDTELIINFLHYMEQNNSTHLMNRIGFDVGMNDDLKLIESMWKRFANSNMVLNLWQGDGFTNCFSPFYNLERLTKALAKRDQLDGYPKKVYQWTIDLHERIREALRLGVDAIMTNHPERLLTILREPEMAHNFRLATSEDDPFRKIIMGLSTRNNVELARHQRSTIGSGNGGFLASIYDVFVSWFTYIKEIPFLSLPTTSRLFGGGSSSAKQRQKLAGSLTTTNNSIEQQSVTVTEVKTNLNQPEYRVDGQNNDSQNATTSNSTSSTKQVSISEQSADQNETTTTTNAYQLPPYEGPKWYTSLISNVLVSALKVVLPT